MTSNAGINGPRVAVVIPCFNVKDHILDVIEKIGPDTSLIYVIDDKCPQRTGDHVRSHCDDSRVMVLQHDSNHGVGGAVMTGYTQAIADGAQIIVKIDGDGQMDPGLIPTFVDPIRLGQADYTKGNRFYDLTEIGRMPVVRIIGNAALSFMSKMSTGYWNLFDPTNDYTAIHSTIAERLPFGKISRRYFFETDMLFRLNTLRAVVLDIPMSAFYGNEVSNLKIGNILPEFLAKHMRNVAKRIFYNYYLRDLSLASLELPIGLVFLVGGSYFGISRWLQALESGVATPTGTIMLAVLPIIVGVNLLLSFLGFDIASVPDRPIHARLRGMTRVREH